MDEHECLAERFAANRTHLQAVTYRVLGLVCRTARMLCTERTSIRRHDHENESDRLLGGHRNPRLRDVERWCGRTDAFVGDSRDGDAAWLPGVLLDDHWVMEGAWRHSLARPGFSAAQGMGVCRHFLQHDRCGVSHASSGDYGIYAFHL